MIAVARHGLPLGRHRSHDGPIALREARLSYSAGDLDESAKSLDRFDREIGIMREVTGEVIGTELIFGIESFGFQIPSSLSQLGQRFAKSQFPSLRSRAATTRMRLPLSSTDI